MGRAPTCVRGFKLLAGCDIEVSALASRRRCVGFREIEYYKGVGSTSGDRPKDN